MDFSDRIHAHGTRVNDLKVHTCTEEATKTSLILPFLQALGYDAFDPRVVIPEYTADVGTKKGEKVDYAIQRNGEIIMLIEAKCVGDPMDASKASQLHRYFHNISSAKIGILTDGVRYHFFTDLDKPNVMDDKPFMIFDFSSIEPALVEELKKLCNECFDVEVALCAAQDLKYLRQIKRLIAEEMTRPSDDLVKLFARQVYSAPLRNTIVDEFRERVRVAFSHHINDVINARLQGAMQPNAYPVQESSAQAEEQAAPGKTREIVTTVEEMEGYCIVKAILCEVIDPARVVMRDTLSYCGILLDDKNTKPLCRLHFNAASVKYIETFDEEKKGTRHKIEHLNDIYQFADTLKATANGYDERKE